MQEIRRAGYLLIVLVLGALTVSYAWRPAAPPRFTGLRPAAIPARVIGYTATESSVDPDTKAALGSAQIAARRYVGPSGRIVDVVVIAGTDRSALHDPRSCLIGAGWKIDRDRIEPIAPGVPARACIATLSPAGGAAQYGYDIVYLYVRRRRVIASATAIRLSLLESALLDQSDAPVTFMRLMTPLAQGQAYPAEHATLMRFAGDFWRQSSPSILNGENDAGR
jgi:hypothetical protein